MSEPAPDQKTKQTAEPRMVEVRDSEVVQEEGQAEAAADQQEAARPPETGGPTGPEPTRYGDWERKGRCIDF